MSALDERLIDWYVSTGEPMDKAGAYAVQGLGAMFIEAIDGNYTNVVGLLLPALLSLMRRAGSIRSLLRRPGCGRRIAFQ